MMAFLRSQCCISRRCGLALLLLLPALAQITASETTITPLPNNFSPAEDVALGRSAAAGVYERLAIVGDPLVGGCLRELGERLVGTIPTTLRQPGFGYSFDVVNVNDIASFALPGGPIFVSRGMIAAARSEDELAGILAHQVSHVALRHGTAQATSGERFQIGAIAGRTIGAVAGGAGGDIFALGARFGVRTYFLMHDPEHERQADRLATQIMARAGYDPRAIATMFRRIESEGRGHDAWQWMQSHPDFDVGEDYISRHEYISRQAATLAVERSTSSPGHFDLVQIRLRELPRAPTAEPASPAHQGGAQAHGVGVVVPSGSSRIVMAGDMLRVHVPANWRRLMASNTVIFAPDRAFVASPEGPSSFTHGMQVGIARSTTRTLENDTQALVHSFRRENPALRWGPVFRDTTIAGRIGITTVVNNVSVVTGRFEYMSVSTAHLPDGDLLYVIGIAPEDEAGTYRRAFERVLESIQIVE